MAMKNIVVNKGVVSVFLLLAFCPYAMGYGGGYVINPEDGSAVSMTRVLFTTPHGELFEQSGTIEELLGPELGRIPEITVDGVQTTDPVALLQATKAEVMLANGETLLLERQGDVLLRVSEHSSFDEGPAEWVRWNANMDMVWISTPHGAATVNIEGVENTVMRLRYIGYLSFMALGGHMAMPELDSSGEKAIPVLVALAILGVVGYIACITIGQYYCGQAAIAGCGSGNVEVYKVICGAGTDVSGTWRLGYYCSYLCK